MTAARNNWYKDYAVLVEEEREKLVDLIENSNSEVNDINSVVEILDGLITETPDENPGVTEEAVTYSSTERSNIHIPLMFMIFINAIKGFF